MTSRFVTFISYIVLRKAFDTFCQGKDFVTPEIVGTILRMMGTAFTDETLKETIAEIDVDGEYLG